MRSSLKPYSQGRCATRLRYAPTGEAPLILNYFHNLTYYPRLPSGAKNSPTL
jgi:hypothetical protein